MLTALGLMALVGLGLAVFQLPGTWLILISAVGYDWFYGWSRLTLKWLVALALIAIAAEVFELVAGAFVSGKAGASRKAMIGAVVGGFAGMVVLTAAIPIPVVGTIIGGLIGCFVGAVVGEMSVHSEMGRSARVGIFAVIGRIIGLVAKTSAAVLIAGVTFTLALMSMLADAPVVPTVPS